MNPAVEYEDQRNRRVPFFSSLRIKYALSYFAILAVVLVLLNTYPVLASQDLLFSSKLESLKSQAAVMGSALTELESLNSEQVLRVMNKLDSMGLDRILVTDPSGLILYDSLDYPEGETESTTPPTDEAAPVTYRYALFREVVMALQGKDVSYSTFTNDVFVTTAATPIVYRGMTNGAIYIYEIDEAQGALLLSLQQNLRNASIFIAAIALVISLLFSNVLTARIAALLRAFRIVGEGEYGHRLEPEGKDELAQLAAEFNLLTDRLQTTEEVRRRFVSDASHELKTPLASIRLLSDSILQNEQMDQETMHDFVSDIGEEAERLTRITEHLLTLTRLDSLPEGHADSVEIVPIVQRAVAMLTQVSRSADVTIETTMTPGLSIYCTRDELYQICYNLIENAIKYNRSGGRVMVSVYQETDQVLLEIADTGVGIPEEDRPKVFNRFYRVDKARSRAAGGTGLGLSIVRDTVRRHGGWVTVRPRHPEGSVFTVGFPLDTSDGGEAL